MVEKFFIPKPENTGRNTGGLNGATFDVYRTAEGESLKWSGRNALPTIGADVLVTMNSIGPAVVKGYFMAAGFLGVMVKPSNPPAWLVRQNKADKNAPAWRKENIACIFGAELG